MQRFKSMFFASQSLHLRKGLSVLAILGLCSLSGCAVIAVADAAASIAVSTASLAVDAAVGTAKVAGKIVGKVADKTVDAVLPDK